MQILTLAGTTGKDAELRRMQNGDPVLNFSLAADNGKDRNGNRRDPTWYDCSIFGKRAESLQHHITKGLRLTLTGRPTARVHNDKVYLGISVNELAFQGGGQERGGNSGGYNQEPEGYGGSGYGAGGRPSRDLGDSIPFNYNYLG